MLSRIIDERAPISRITWKAAVQAPPAARHAENENEPPVDPREFARLQSRLAETEARLAEESRAAYQTGFAEGMASAKAASEEQVRDALERLAQSIAEVTSGRKRVFDEAEMDLVKLSIEVARRILHRELTVDPDAVEALVKGALDKLQGQLIYKVRVHPEHEQIVRAYMQQFGTGAEIQIIGDPMRERGAVVFELDSGNLDASIETQLREIERGLADGLTA